MKEKVWLFDENQLREVIVRWVKKEIDNGHPKAIRNAQFVGQQMAAMFKAADHLLVSADDEKAAVPKPHKDVDLNNMEEFKQLIGESWENLE